MQGSRLFTDEELKELGTPSAELIQTAIDAGDMAKAKALTQQLHTEASSLHDAFGQWITSLLSFIGRNYGDEALERALKESSTVVFGPVAKLYEQCAKEGNVRARAELFVRGLRTHYVPMKIEEDEEKLVLEMHPCGSGGRMILDGYYEPPVDFLKVKKPQPITFGRKDFPVYCTHAAMFAMLGIEWTGAPIFFEDPSDKLGEKPCKLYFYKFPEKAPAEFYTKVGRKKGSS
ncbi:MAG: hypothetical protein NTU41_11395 [Chloroflexi bacterium]|nr:hypothetical protein [Chloroflexota bacterium]